jgi:hypothetical protein
MASADVTRAIQASVFRQTFQRLDPFVLTNAYGWPGRLRPGREATGCCAFRVASGAACGFSEMKGGSIANVPVDD